MGSKAPLVQYRRTSSDMDLSTSDEDDNVIQESNVIIEEQLINKSVPNDQSKFKNSEDEAKLSVAYKSQSSSDTVYPSTSIKDDRLDGDRLREQKSRDDKRENGRRDSRSKDYGKERRDKRKTSSDSKYRDRSSSPDRRKRRSPDRSRRSPHRHRSRSPGRRKYSPDRRERKRSHSPDYRSRRYRGSRLERKVARIDKLGLELFAEAKTTGAENPMLANFCNPGTLNPAARLTEQIQKRKLLWGAKKEAPAVGEAVNDSAGTSKTWEAATFKGDNDGKMTEKFKRLMGIKGDGAPAAAAPTPPANNSLIKKQEEMFSNMEAQYQVARMATHTHRGIGLGFGTFQVPPR